jgi:hypothetical protein
MTTEKWPAFEAKVLDEARIQDNTGKTVWTPPDHVAVVRIRTKIEGIIPVPKTIVDNHRAMRRYVVDELHRRIDFEPKDAMTATSEPGEPETPETDPATEPDPNAPEPTPTPEPETDPADPHVGPLDDDEDARYLDPVDPRRREVERRRGKPFGDEQETR